MTRPDIKSLIAKAASGQPLTRDEAQRGFDIMMTGEATPSQIGGLLMALRVRGETVDEIAGAIASMRSRMVPVEAPADAAQKARLAKLSPEQIQSTELAGEKIDSVLDHAPGNGAAIGGIKVIAANGWFAARPSGTEDIYKIYAESFRDQAHLRRLLQEAQTIVDSALANP